MRGHHRHAPRPPPNVAQEHAPARERSTRRNFPLLTQGRPSAAACGPRRARARAACGLRPVRAAPPARTTRRHRTPGVHDAPQVPCQTIFTPHLVTSASHERPAETSTPRGCGARARNLEPSLTPTARGTQPPFWLLHAGGPGGCNGSPYPAQAASSNPPANIRPVPSGATSAHISASSGSGPIQAIAVPSVRTV